MAGYDMTPLDAAESIKLLVLYNDGEKVTPVTISVQVEWNMPQLQEEIYTNFSVPVSQQIITFNDQELSTPENREKTLGDVGIIGTCKIHLKTRDVIELPPSSPLVETGRRSPQPKGGGQKSKELGFADLEVKTHAAPSGAVPTQGDEDEELTEAQKAIIDDLVYRSKVNCRITVLLVLIAVIILFAEAWGSVSMIYYFLVVIFAIAGWYGFRRVDWRLMIVFTCFLMIEILDLLITSIIAAETGEKGRYSSSAVYVTLMVFEMLLDIAWFVYIVKFVNVARRALPVDLAKAVEKTKTTAVCV